mmetsp:Transcript_19627/g.26078  ORF Transcript_19627/g.26078 Transcript_19627/m.26078 type:complete len:141 (+) Transcript_19627:244-666(+)
MGNNENNQNLCYNFWKNGSNPKGLWRHTTMDSYKPVETKWETVLNLDDWVWKGSRPLPCARDPLSNNGTRVTRALLSLLRGGANAIHLREFDLLTNKFVPSFKGGFILGEAKTHAMDLVDPYVVTFPCFLFEKSVKCLKH